MFIVVITYKKPLEDVDKYLAEHRAFLDGGYRDNLLVASGPRNPRTGGILISQLQSREQLEDFLKQDPFKLHEIADYEIIEFSPVKYHPNFASFV